MWVYAAFVHIPLNDCANVNQNLTEHVLKIRNLQCMWSDCLGESGFIPHCDEYIENIYVSWSNILGTGTADMKIVDHLLLWLDDEITLFHEASALGNYFILIYKYFIFFCVWNADEMNSLFMNALVYSQMVCRAVNRLCQCIIRLFSVADFAAVLGIGFSPVCRRNFSVLDECSVFINTHYPFGCSLICEWKYRGWLF